MDEEHEEYLYKIILKKNGGVLDVGDGSNKTEPRICNKCGMPGLIFKIGLMHWMAVKRIHYVLLEGHIRCNITHWWQTYKLYKLGYSDVGLGRQCGKL